MEVKNSGQNTYIFITIGEIMLRLTPPNHEKIRMASSFEASYGGSEANIALALANLGMTQHFLPLFPITAWEKALSDAEAMMCTAPGDLPVHLRRRPLYRMGCYYLKPGTGSGKQNYLRQKAQCHYRI